MSSERRPPDDDELEDFLSGKSDLSSAYREASSRDTAPPALDAPILDAAREAARTPMPRAARRPRWLRPLAFAATFVLSLGVLLSVYRQPELRQEVIPGEDRDLHSASTPTASGAAPEIEAETGAATRDERASDEAGQVKQKATAAEASRDERRARRIAIPPKGDDHLRYYGLLKDEAVPPKPEPSSPAPTTENRAAAPAPAAAPPPPVERDDAAPAAAFPAEPAPAAPTSRDALGSLKREVPAPATAGAAAMPKKSAPAPMLESAAPAAKASDRQDLQPAVDRAQETALAQGYERIRAMRDRGDLEGARRELAALRKQHPEAEIPEDLRGLE